MLLQTGLVDHGDLWDSLSPRCCCAAELRLAESGTTNIVSASLRPQIGRIVTDTVVGIQQSLELWEAHWLVLEELLPLMIVPLLEEKLLVTHRFLEFNLIL